MEPPCWRTALVLQDGDRTSANIWNLLWLSTIPDKRVGTPSKFSSLPIFNVDNQLILFPFLLEKKNAIFSNIEYGGWGTGDKTQVSQLLLAGIIDRLII